MVHSLLRTSRVGPSDGRPVFFFDIDDCLYSGRKGIDAKMYDLTEQFMIKDLKMTNEQAARLHRQYYQEFGATIKGLMRFHNVHPGYFNSKVDDALPLDDILTEDRHLQRILGKFDRSKVKLWLLTNAHITHAQRVVRILGVERFFEGITFCDYASGRLRFKPQAKMYARAEKDAEVTCSRECFFVDNSLRNCVAAQERGWNAVHLLEGSPRGCANDQVKYQIGRLEELLGLFPQFALSNPTHSGDRE